MGKTSIPRRNTLAESTTADTEGRRAIGAALFPTMPEFVHRLLTTSVAHPERLRPFDFRQMESATRELLVALLEKGRVPAGAEWEPFTAECERALRAGVPPEQFARTLHLMLRETWRTFVDIGGGLPIGTDVYLRLAADMMDMWSLGLGIVVETAARLAEAEARVDQQRRAILLNAVLTGSARPADLAAFPDRSYLPLRARADDGTRLATLERVLAHSQPGDRPAILAVVDGDLAGLVAQRPSLDDRDSQGVVVGLGPPARLDAVAPAFQLATRALDTAAAFGYRGVWTLEELGVRAAIAAESHLGRRFVGRYLERLDAYGAFGRTLCETLATWFAHGMRMEETAQAIPIHVNTLRYRLRRYEEITGVDLARTEARFELFWALQATVVEAAHEAGGREVGPT